MGYGVWKVMGVLDSVKMYEEDAGMPLSPIPNLRNALLTV